MNRSRCRGGGPLAATLILLPGLVLAAAGCSSAPSPHPFALAQGIDDGRHHTLEAWPSAHAAAMLPARARYRLVLSAQGELGLLVLTPDDRIYGHWRVRPRASSTRSLPGVQVEFEAGTGAVGVEAWSSGHELEGRSFGSEAASWRVRLGGGGQLAGTSWRVEGSHHPATELRRARAVAADLQALTATWIHAGPLRERDPCELTDRLALAHTAIELSIRAVEGRGRSSLPKLASLIPEPTTCE